MTSWRDSVPDSVQDHLDGLFSVALDAASEFLVKSGELYLFGFSVGVNYQIAMLGADPGVGEHPQSTEVLRMLGDSARATREQLQAVAFTVDVTRPDGGDAVRVQLEHRAGLRSRSSFRTGVSGSRERSPSGYGGQRG